LTPRTKRSRVSLSELKLWPHQRAAYDAMARYVRAVRSGKTTQAGLVHMPTGTGKTGVIACLARLLPDVGTTLVVAPRIALRRQLRDDIERDFFADREVALEALPKKVHELVPGRSVPNTRDIVLVSTIQLLASLAIRDALAFQTLLKNVELVLVDEGHSEPAPLWSRAIREFRVPRILFTATPFRNDLKRFDIDFANHWHSFSFSDAVAARVIRDIDVVPQRHPHDPGQFVDQLLDVYRKHFGAPSVTTPDRPKVIIRCEDKPTVQQIAAVLLDRKQSVLAVHERFPDVPAPGREHLRRRVPNREERRRLNPTFYVHQYKLLEGIDEPSLRMVAMYQPLKAARGLVQQIGRVLRNPGARRNERAILVDHSGGTQEEQWRRYRKYDEELKTSPWILSTPLEKVRLDALLKALPPLAYMNRDFRSPLDPRSIDDPEQIRLPFATKIYRRTAGFDFGRMVSTLLKDMEADDRAHVCEHRVSADTALMTFVTTSYSSYLDDDYFAEERFGAALLHTTRSHVFLFDSGGSPTPGSGLGRRIPPAVLRRLLTGKGGGALTYVSLRNSNLSAGALRSRGLSAVSLESVAPSFEDHLYVCKTARGRIRHSLGSDDTVRRYVGFGNAKVSDNLRLGSIEDHVGWLRTIDATLEDSARPQPKAFQRFAGTGDPPSDLDPVHVLLDLEGVDELFATNDDTADPLDIEEWACEVKTDGTFELLANSITVKAAISYDAGRGVYLLSSEELDERYKPRHAHGFNGLTDFLNEEQRFRVLPKSTGVCYANGDFYKPLLRTGSEYDEAQLDLLPCLFPHEVLNHISDEKGKKTLPGGKGWQKGTLFDLLATCGEGTGFAKTMDGADLLVCDDMGTESADFVLAGPQRVVLIHAKASAKRSLYSCTALTEPVGQGTKNLRYLHPFEEVRPTKCENWHRNAWTAPKVEGKVKSRVILGKGTGTELWALCQKRMRSPMVQREVWLVLGNMFSKQAFEKELRSASPAHAAIQSAYLLEGLISTAMAIGVSVRVMCSP
jgi:superfamily II DNA or RNA helicase